MTSNHPSVHLHQPDARSSQPHYNPRQPKPPSSTSINYINCEQRITPQSPTTPNNSRTWRGYGSIPSRTAPAGVQWSRLNLARQRYHTTILARQTKLPSSTSINHTNCEHVATSDPSSTTHLAQNALHLDHLQHPTTPNIARGGGIPSRMAPASVQWSREPCPTALPHYNPRQTKLPSSTSTNHTNCEHIATPDPSTTLTTQNATTPRSPTSTTTIKDNMTQEITPEGVTPSGSCAPPHQPHHVPCDHHVTLISNTARHRQRH